MELLFIKQLGKPVSFKCIRADKSSTYMLIFHTFNLERKLIHYALETVLGFNQAYYGLLEKGHSLKDFEVPSFDRPMHLKEGNLPEEAIQSEILSSLFHIELNEETTIDGFIDVAKITFEARNIKFPDLAEDQINKIREKIHSLLEEWNLLGAGNVLSLHFQLVKNNKAKSTNKKIS